MQLFVGDQRLVLEVGRPMEFGTLTLTSRPGCSKRTVGLEGKSVRAVAKRTISAFARPIATGPFLDMRHIEPNNVSHLLMDIIPLCLMARAAVPEVTFIFRTLEPRFRELLAHFEIRPLSTYRPIRGEQLSYRLSRGLAQFGLDEHFDAPLYSYTGEVYADYIGAGSGPGRIFISRRGPRSPVNAADLNTFLSERGFVVVHLEDLSIVDQIALMQNADRVVAIHGAALAYLALKNRTAAVVEIMPPNVYHDHFPIGIGHKVGRYIQLIPSFDEDVQFQGWPAIYRHKQSPFAVDLAQLEQALDECDRPARKGMAATAAA